MHKPARQIEAWVLGTQLLLGPTRLVTTSLGTQMQASLQHKPPYSIASAATHVFMRCKKIGGNT
jgi:hypothetical protein